MSEIVKSYYNENADLEWKRLINPYGKIEFLSTLYLIDKYFKLEGKACDIGSGPGRYSIELLNRGLNVTLFELSQNELNIAKERISELGLKADGYICDNALNLHQLESESYDSVLLMGPMYHLLDRNERMIVLRETYRILKKGGRAIIAYLNSWGILKAGVTEFYEVFSDIKNVYDYLKDQTFDNNRGFTDVYFATPPKALEEVKEANFSVISYAGAEGFLSGIETNISLLYKDEPSIYENLIKVASETCELPQYRDATEHLHIVVEKL